MIYYLFFKAAPALDDEQDRNDLLNTQEELRKLGSDRERRKYFQRKHGNERRADPAMNLSSFSWRPSGDEGLPSEKEGEDQVTNRDSYDKDKKVIDLPLYAKYLLLLYCHSDIVFFPFR